jgi:hypothetical protein
MMSRREGFALVATMLAMLVVGAIVTGGFYAASQESQITRSLSHADDALSIAETGMNQEMASTLFRSLDSIAIGTTRTNPSQAVTVNSVVKGNYVTKITRLTTSTFVFQSDAQVIRGGRNVGAGRTLATMARVRTADFDNQAAVVIYSDLRVGGSSEVDGTDQYPVEWTGQDCPPLTGGTAAVVTNPGTTIETMGGGVINGTISRQTLSAGTFTVFGDLTWNDLVAMAEKRYPTDETVNPVAVWSGTSCTTSIRDNWGQPLIITNPCFNYAPIIYAAQDLHISSSNRGQGILLVEGNLDISGGFTFHGVVVVKGRLTITGTGGHINGTAMAYGGGDLDSVSSVMGNALLQYSSCSIDRAVKNNSAFSRAVPIYHRSWMDMTAIKGGN